MNDVKPIQPDSFEEEGLPGLQGIESALPFNPMAAALEFEAEEKPAAPAATLEFLSEKAQEMLRLQAEINDQTVALAEKQAELDRISSRTIPDIMAQLQMASFAMADGSKLEVKADISASITEENRPEAHKWLREHNYAGIIKTKVIAEFGKDELEKAEAAQTKLKEQGYDATLSEAVHAATLKAFVKERLEAGEQIPMKAFGVFERKKTVITVPKKKKAK